MNVKTLIMTCMMLVTKVRLMSSTLISLATSCGSTLYKVNTPAHKMVNNAETH